jgi:hypothetical protein
MAGTFVGGNVLLHVHAALFSAWCVLFVTQSWLVARGHVADHRAWGLVGVSLASVMVVIGFWVAVHAENVMLAKGYGDQARAFFYLPLTGILEFAAFFAAAVALRRKTEWHKRFMLAGTAGLLEAGAARIGFLMATGGGPGARPGLSPPPPVASGIAGSLIVSAFLLAALVYDWRSRGRPHPATLIGLVAILGFGFLGPAIAATPAWMRMVDALAAFAK